MASYLARYQSGEREQVWAELTALGQQVRQEHILPDALAVSYETMRRVKHNAEAIAARLKSIRYRFDYDPEDERSYAFDAPYYPPSPNAIEQVAELESLAGPLPLSLRAWYEIGGSINFLGSHDLWPDAYTDPLVIYPVEVTLTEYSDWQEMVADEGLEEVGPFSIPIAPDFYHKNDTSGGGPYSIEMPSLSADAMLNEWHEANFVEYLRECFRWGGFPGFDIRHPMNPQHLVADCAMPPEHLALLTADLLPI